MFRVAALYKFVSLPDFEALQPEIARFCAENEVSGTLLLAPEGINGTVAGTPDAIARLIKWLEDGNLFGGRFRDAEIKYADAERQPFHRMKVRLKKEIVTLKAPEADPTKNVGTYVQPDDWNDLIGNEDVVLVDTRNDYEVGIGTFEGALDPKTKTFTEFKTWVADNLDPERDKKVAMFCTGGIRCEKASSYLLSKGFEEVFHLKGGILNYLETIPEDQSTWNGECFVFDERVSVTHGLEKGEAELCRACRQPLLAKDRSHPDFIEGVQCHNCAGTDDERRERAKERQRQMELAAERGETHLGDAARQQARQRHNSKLERREADRNRNRKSV